MKNNAFRKTKRKIIALLSFCMASVFLICTPVCAAESVVGITFDGSDSPYVEADPVPTPIPTPNPNPNPPKKEENKNDKEDAPQESNDDKSDEPSPLLGSENTTHMGVTVTAVSETEYETLTEGEIVSSEKEEKFDAVNTIGEKLVVINKNLFGTATTTRLVDDGDTTGEIKNVSEIVSHFLTEEDIEAYNNGSEIAIVLNISDSVPILEEDKEDVSYSVLESETVGAIFDINLVKSVDGVSVAKFTQLDIPIQISIAVPENLVKEGRTYSVIRVHKTNSDKVVDRLADEDDVLETVTFSTDRFSTYALVYEDATVIADDTGIDAPIDNIGEENVDQNEDKMPDTVRYFLIGIFISVVIFLILFFVFKRTEKSFTNNSK